jgi:hypothetical protein
VPVAFLANLEEQNQSSNGVRRGADSAKIFISVRTLSVAT